MMRGARNDPEISIKWPNVEGENKDTTTAEGYNIDGVDLRPSDKEQKWVRLKDTFKFWGE